VWLLISDDDMFSDGEENENIETVPVYHDNLIAALLQHLSYVHCRVKRSWWNSETLSNLLV